MVFSEAPAFWSLLVMIALHAGGTVWWASSVTERVRQLERWISANQHTAERIAAMEQRIENISQGVARIEDVLRRRR